jgi:flagella basal body P-ring formation protein FlgA
MFALAHWYSLRWHSLLGATVVCSYLGISMAAAQEISSLNLQGVAQEWLQEATSTVNPAGLRLEVKVGSLDSRLKLAACGNVEPYLPQGTRLWGRTRVGLRCVDGISRWNVSLPVTVNAFGNAWVVKGSVQAGAVLTQSDVVEAEVNWAEEANPVLRDRSLWVGHVATRQLTTGQTLRQGMVKPAQVFPIGAQVRVVADGPGFQVSTDAFALTGGVVGQVARVRMENGKVSSGVVLDMRTVKIDL